jgi:N-acyl-D-amino-acid deacylase
VRYQLGDRVFDPFREALAIGRGAECPVHITHFYRRTTSAASSDQLLDLVDSAQKEGVEVTFDAYPYPFSSTRLLILIPNDLQAGGPDQLLERLSDRRQRPAIRQAIEARARAYRGDSVWETIHLNGFRREENSSYEGKTIAEVVAARGQHPADVICELLISEDLAVNEVAVAGDPDAIGPFLRHQLAMVGTDSVFIGKRPSPRTYGSYPRILGEFVREMSLLSLPDAIRKMTTFPAQRLGLADRGQIRDGMAADIVVFDPATVRSNATFEQPRQYPDGIRFVIVNGEVVLDDGVMTENRPGRALRLGHRT